MKKNLRTLSNLVFTFFLVAATGEILFADAPAVHISPKPLWILLCKAYDKKPSARAIENGAYDELIEEQVNVEEKATFNHFITQIVSESGVQNNSEISVSFDPSYERLDFHEVIVWRDNKPQNRLNAGAFKILAEENELEKFIYNGTFSAKYIMADIRKGDRIEYSYTITGRNPIFNNQFCRSIYLQGADLIVHQYTTLLFSAARKMNIKSFNLRSQPRISIAGGLKRYEWEDFQVPGALTNKLEPKWFNTYSRVQVSDYSSWEEVIKWGLKINPLHTVFTGELENTIEQLKQQSGNDKEKYFRSAVTLVQDEVRYMGIETGEYSHKANAPDKVFKQRYGDCKDKSLLLASILNAGGIEAHLALLNTGLDDSIENFTPSPVLFDHAVVVADVGGKQVWVDATISYQRGKGTDLYFPPYGEGLILKPGNKGLNKIKQTKTGKIVSEENYEIKDEHSPVKFSVTTTYTLDQADQIREHIASTGIAGTEKNYLNYYSKIYNKIEAADSLLIKDNESKNELTTIERYKIRDFFKRDSITTKYTANFYADDIAQQLPDIGGQIATPVSVNYPYDIDCTTNIFMSDGSGWDIADDHYAINRSAYKFAYDKTVKHEKLSLHYRFLYLRDFVSLDKLSEFKQDIKQLKDSKLSFSFYYTPDIKKMPFQINKLMLVVTFMVMCIFTYYGLRIYKTETREQIYQNRNYSGRPLGGWLVVLIIILFVSPLGTIKYLVGEGYYTISKWDLITTGTGSIINRAFLMFEVTGHVALICSAAFCLVLVFMKRDIAPHYIKAYYLFLVIFLFVDYFFNVFVKGQSPNYDVEGIIRSVIIAAVWTYYLNVSERAKETFVVPYPGN